MPKVTLWHNGFSSLNWRMYFFFTGSTVVFEDPFIQGRKNSQASFVSSADQRVNCLERRFACGGESGSLQTKYKQLPQHLLLLHNYYYDIPIIWLQNNNCKKHRNVEIDKYVLLRPQTAEPKYILYIFWSRNYTSVKTFPIKSCLRLTLSNRLTSSAATTSQTVMKAKTESSSW